MTIEPHTIKKMVERHMPIGKADYLSIQHVERYRFAIENLTPPTRVLDIASGGGYGTAMLLKHGCHTIGVDYDQEPLEVAQELWNFRCFIRGDALSLPFRNNSFESIVSFETIEHVANGKGFLEEMHRILKRGGIFICSTPNIRYTFHPPAHVKEYAPKEFFNLVSETFPDAEHYGQYFEPIDRFRDLYMRKLLPAPLEIIRKHLEPILIRLKLKMSLEKLLLASHLTALNPDTKVTARNWLNTIFYSQPAHRYEVKPFSGSQWLRIMIVVARKL